jgi:parallel beta-helix repeat protein
VIISNTQVLSNSAGSYGGGIEVNLDAVANIVNSEIISNTATEEGGGGISIHNRARALVTDSRILSNTLTQGWASAGIVASDDALVTLYSNEIAWNKGLGNRGPSGGVRLNANSIVTAVNNHIHHNVVNDGDGGAISADRSTLRAYSNTMVHNQARSGGALRFGNNVNAIVDGNVIAENDVTGSGGGAHIYNSVVTFTNNTITENEIDGNGSGGGTNIYDSVATFVNNIIASNSGNESWNGDGLAIRGPESDARVVNNTIFSNTAEGIDASDGAEVLVRNNIIANNNGGIHNWESGATFSVDHNARWNNNWTNVTMGTGDIEADPVFVDAANGDFHLQMDSPCIDAGNPTGAPALDIEGKPRDAAPDIGAYEWGQYLIFLPITVRNLSPQESLQADFTASPTSGTAPLTVTFTNTSSGAYTSNLWHFGDGATSTLENPTHVYTTARAYTVALTVSGADDTDTITRANYIIVNTPSTGIRYLAPGGTDTDNDCSNSAEPCATVQHAVDVSAPGDEIRVAGGTYTDLNVRPRNDITTTSVVTQVAYVSKTVSIRGGYSTSDWSTPDPDANPTTLDAQRQGRGLYITGDITATLENLRITGGDATGLGGRQTWDGIVDTGGGVYAFNATLSISNSRLVSNTAWTGGGGYIAGSAHLDDNVIMDNFANGIGYENGGAGLFLEGGVTLTNNTITGNKSRANGGGLMTGYAQATLTGNTISGNVAGYTSGSSRMSEALAPLMPTACGGGAYLGTATLTNNTFSGNTATERGGGVMVFYGDVVMMEDNLFADNTTEGRGGGVYVIHSGPVEMMSNEITGNAADWFGVEWLSRGM